MRRIILLIFIFFFALLFLPRVVLAAEQIDSFNSAITINQDGSIDVVETINYDFGTSDRHGILRDIPYIKANSDGKKFRMNISVQSVMRDGTSEKYATNKENDTIHIKIGDANRTITGQHVYEIIYEVKGALTYFSDHDELYWNVTGNNWQIPIKNSKLEIRNSKITEQVKFICYTGIKGSTTQECAGRFDESTNEYIVSTNAELAPFEGLTVVISLPKGLVAVLEPVEIGSTWWERLIALVFLIVGFLWYIAAPLFIIYRWWSAGRDPATNKPVTAWFEAPKDGRGRRLTPAELGVLTDEHADMRDISATIVDLAIRGVLQIKELPKKGLFGKTEYEFTLVQQNAADDPSFEPFERKLIEGMFGSTNKTSTKDMKDSFYTTVSKVHEILYKDLQRVGFFPHNPATVRTVFYVVAFVALFTLNIPLAAVAFLFGWHMPRKTLMGAQKKTEGIGLFNFLKSQSRQLTFQAKEKYLFEKLLPYAIVFGVETIWAQRFEHLALKPPDWYSGSYGSHFNSVVFTNSLSNSLNRVQSVSATPTRSSSGFSSGFSGGSSGGGGGGGGGGNW